VKRASRSAPIYDVVATDTLLFYLYADILLLNRHRKQVDLSIYTHLGTEMNSFITSLGQKEHDDSSES